MPRTYTPLEEEMLVGYITQRFPNAQVWFHVRLGALPNISIPGLDPERARRLGMPTLPEVDAIVRQGSDVWLAEAKLFKEWDNLGKITIYRTLLPKTPGWEQVDMAKVHMLMILGRVSAPLLELAQNLGVEVAVYLTDRAREILVYGFPSQR